MTTQQQTQSSSTPSNAPRSHGQFSSMKQPQAPQSPHFGASVGQFGGGEGVVEDDIGAIAWLCCRSYASWKKNDELAAEIRDAELLADARDAVHAQHFAPLRAATL